LIVRAASV